MDYALPSPKNKVELAVVLPDSCVKAMRLIYCAQQLYKSPLLARREGNANSNGQNTISVSIIRGIDSRLVCFLGLCLVT